MGQMVPLRATKEATFGMLSKNFRRSKKSLELSYFKGLNHQEISELLELSLGTVKSRIRLGSKNFVIHCLLKKLLNESYETTIDNLRR